MGPIETEPSPAEARAAARMARLSGDQTGRESARLGLRLLRAAVALAVVGTLLLIVAEFLPLLELRTRRGTAGTVNVGPHHSWAGLLLAVTALVLTLGFARTGSRPAALAVATLGLAAVLVALIGDVPDTRRSGLAGSPLAEAHAHALAGAYAETLAGVLIALGGGLGALPKRE